MRCRLVRDAKGHERTKDTKTKIRNFYLPRPAVKYPGCYPAYFEKRLPEILETSDYIHLFAGMSFSGLRVDIKPEVSPDVVADVHTLPFPDGCFLGGMADPPYTKEFAQDKYRTEYPRWNTWTKELVRVVQPGGRIGIMHNYVVPRLAGCIMEEIIVILLRIKQYPKIVTVQRKESET